VPDDVVPIAGDSGAAPDEVVPIAGDSTGPVPPAPGSERPIITTDPWDNTGYEDLAAAVDVIFPFWPDVPPLPDWSDGIFDGPTEVVPIAGDSAPPSVDDEASYGADGRYVGPQPDPTPPPAPPPPSPPIDYSGIDDAIDELLDALGVPTPEPGLLSDPPPPPRNPWLLVAIVAAVVLVTAAVIGFAVTRGSSSHSASPPSSTASSTTTTAATSTTSGAIPATDVTMSLGLGEVSGRTLPLQVTMQAASDAPHALTVKVAFTGPGIQPSDTFQVAPGASVTHTIVANGCGSWTMQVVSIDGQPVHANGNPNLQNGATHNC
jgi:hypothetical protein